MSAKRLQKPGSKPHRSRRTTGAVPLRNRELSWLSFNARVLQEASNPDVPVLERLRFLGIFSNNLDEFFRIRVASLKRLVALGPEAARLMGTDPRVVLKEIRETVMEQQKRFDLAFGEAQRDLAAQNIHIITEGELDEDQVRFVRAYFRDHVREHLIPIMIDQIKTLPSLRDQSSYLAIRLTPARKRGSTYALIEVPTHVESRFLVLPPRGEHRYVILLDDVIRCCLDDVFAGFGFAKYEAYAVKITRDAELDLVDDLSQRMVKKVMKSLGQRRTGTPVRFTYDADLPKAIHDKLVRKLRLGRDDAFLPGQRYHNFRDFMDFPDLGSSRLRYRALKPMLHPAFADKPGRLLKVMRNRDVLVHYPYHSFDHVTDLLRECSIDPKVTSIRLTIYRAAKQSSVINALINAARNGKAVTAVLELQARFDEAANLDWGKQLQDDGVHVIYGVPGLKVHGKLCLITRMEKRQKMRYAIVGTGNFNEDTARIYTDHALFTADPRITREVRQVFRFCESNYSISTYRHLWVSPFNMRMRLRKLIRAEIKHAAQGRNAFIRIKVNNLVDDAVIRDLYAAGQSGVRVDLIVRSMFSLVPGVPGTSDTIQAISIVDRFLEHSRIFVFGNGGTPLYFISSADLMTRNIDRRVEVVCPIYDESLQQELATYLDLQWRDTTRARILDAELANEYREPNPGEARVHAQVDTYRWLHRPCRASGAAAEERPALHTTD